MESEIRTRLLALPAISNVIGDRYFPFAVPENVNGDSIVYEVVTITKDRFYGDRNDEQSAIIRITPWCAKYETTKSIAKAIHDSIDQFSGTMGALEFLEVFEVRRTPIYDSDAKAYGINLEYETTYREV